MSTPKLQLLEPLNVTKDWNQNDPTQPDYVKNRTHYEETVMVNKPLNLTWDGNTEGLVSVENLFFKVSDLVLTDEQIKSGTMVIMEYESIPVLDVWDDAWVTADAIVLPFMLFCRKDGAILEGVTIPQKGIYFLKEEEFYASGFITTEPVEHLSTVVHKLDTKYLPDKLPFINTIDGIEITWDGDTTTGGDVVENLWYKVSDKTIPYEQLAGSTITLSNGNGITISADMIGSPSGNLASTNGSGNIILDGNVSSQPIVIIVHDAELFNAEYTGNNADFEQGIYFLYGNGNYVSSLSTHKTEIHKIDPRCLPSGIGDWTQNDTTQPNHIENRTHFETGLDDIVWDGHDYTDTLDYSSDFGSSHSSHGGYFKISELIPSIEILLLESEYQQTSINHPHMGDATTTVITHSIDSTKIVDDHFNGIISYPQVFKIVYDSKLAGVSTGTYFYRYGYYQDTSGGGIRYTSKLTFPKVKKLDNKFLPDISYNDLTDTPEPIQVDTEYSPNSENAQSGKAVAQGIDEALTLTFKDTNNGLPSPISTLDNDITKQTLYWNGTKATKWWSNDDGASADDPIIINTAEELAYVASAKYEDTYGKYFRIADGIDKIVLQSETYYKDIIALDSAEAVREYYKEIIDNQKAASSLFPWVSNTWNEANMCFGGSFDGNGVEIYGMYTSDYTVDNSGLSGNYAGGLFGLIDSAVITNVAVKNSYINLGKGTENFQFGLIASYGKDCDTSKGDNISYINNCTVANNYVYKQVNDTGFLYSGVLLGGNIVGNYIIQNCLVYDNSAIGYYSVGDITEEYNLPIIGRTINGLVATDEFAATYPGWIYNNGYRDFVETVLENSIILYAPLYAVLSTGKTNAMERVLSCSSSINCLKNVYADWDLDWTETNSSDHFNKDYFLANSGGEITKSDIIGDKAVINAPKLEWGVNWFVPKNYSGKSVPFDFLQLAQGSLLKRIQNNTDICNGILNDIKITSLLTTEKYTFDWNAMYLIKSNSGNVDIKLYNSDTGSVVVDGDGNNMPALSLCLIILPKETIGESDRRCMCIGMTGNFSIVNPNVVISRQFNVASGDVYFTPPKSASVFKIAL